MVDGGEQAADETDDVPVDWMSLRAPITVWEWLALPLLYLGAISLPAFYSSSYDPRSHSALGWAFLLVGTVLALGSTATVAVSGFRCYSADETTRPREARAYFRTIQVWGAIYLLDWSIAIFVNAGWGGIAFPLGVGVLWLVLFLMSGRSLRRTVSSRLRDP
jgi:hypothetical protein